MWMTTTLIHSINPQTKSNRLHRHVLSKSENWSNMLEHRKKNAHHGKNHGKKKHISICKTMVKPWSTNPLVSGPPRTPRAQRPGATRPRPGVSGCGAWNIWRNEADVGTGPSGDMAWQMAGVFQCVSCHQMS